MDVEREFDLLARRALAHLQAKTTDQAEAPFALPVEAYIDQARYEREVDRIFRRLPLGLALSIEIPDATSYRALRVLDVPLIIVRGEDGVARAFINALSTITTVVPLGAVGVPVVGDDTAPRAHPPKISRARRSTSSGRTSPTTRRVALFGR